jgi:RNA polymerase sigma-70 factor, ECF subfamily
MTSPSRNDQDHERFAAWSREHLQAVWGYLLAMARHTDVADDLTQEVFCKAWQNRDRYREEGNARAYLLRIADRLLIDRGRKAGREINLDADGWNQIEPASPADAAPQSLAGAEAARQLSAALQQLSPLQCRVILLRYFGQMRFGEIAETVGCPLNTALSHCRRGLAVLREILVEEVS